ncbi:putative disease resistance RPP13-like protein 1 [Arachis hypogaea]|uniref:putative disease resistance RPP13-like protein 1 n=1 Tax=Arachis hypogaea TaxID=3818 RepID=UPI000DEC0EBA|nr:putative disease resistance RPP13-like protein 1 isoform X1 [Arachis hypogaea]XP_029146723.1 putative disease resistance RPP13-like protein 1 isoform X1 [Arachis hypogaea]XP_029146724.1 putative disease resistance RPP13-like protein 1 isoform X1 [Arachis hypogaea]
MAARFVGEAFLNSALGTIYDMLISPLLVNFIQRKKLNRKLVEKLETVLKAAHAVINDAERRQIEEEAVKDWLDRLKYAVYDAEDILDEVTTKAAIQKVQGNSLSRYVNLHGDGEIVTKIEEIIDALESIVNEKDGLGLKEIPVEDMSWRIPSTSLVGVHQIYGRDQDREAIVKLLLDVTNDGGISVITMVGMGGIGKTTLAQIVYNDDRVKQKFDVKAWVCDGQEEFDVLKVTKAVMEATSSSCSSTELNTIQESLKKVLAGKKLLVVLDDMWRNNYDAWISFLKPFKSSNGGVKILVTTRLDSTADMVKTLPTYHLNFLGDDHCWSVFADHACLNSAEPHIRSDLEVVGRKIVKKCNGLALAAQTLGGLLRARKEVADWEFILRSEIWELPKKDSGILPALRISYHYLPSYLKRCFVYCSLFPKDNEFKRDELVLLWMAEGLLQRPKSGSTLEEVGSKYFNDLVSRSFFQHSNTDENLFVMHDLMHDLAIFYGGKFFLRNFELKTADKHDACPRHFSNGLVIDDSLFSEISEVRDCLKNTRTLLDISFKTCNGYTEEIDPCRLLAQLKHVRVLSFKSLPPDELDSIGDLIHLRYLDLSYSSIETLPESMCKFYNLQTLKLNDRDRLEKLPNNMQDLVNLRHLDLSGTSIVELPESLSKLYNLQTLNLSACEELKKLPSKMQDLVNLRHLDIEDTNLEEMPKGMSKLKDLQILSYYIVGEHEENGVGELGELVNLQGSFHIRKLENVVNSSEAWKARMFDKKHINDLRLQWRSVEYGDIVDSEIEKDVLDKLRPHKDLKKLFIWCYRGTMFPDWVGQCSYHNMTWLELRGCRNCWVVPSLGQLPSLERLVIRELDKVKKIGGSFYKGDGTHQHQETPFRSLKYLTIEKLPCWEEWESYECDDDDDAPFPKLETLEIWDCPKLRGDLPTFLPSLKQIYISGCEEIGCYLPRAPILRSLRIDGKQEARMRELPLSMLETLIVNGEQQVEYVFEAMTHTQPTSLSSLQISKCSSVVSFPGDALPPSLKQLSIYDCKNVEFPMQHHQHHSLQRLEIHNSCNSLTFFALPAFPNLDYLSIKELENLTSLELSQSQSLLRLSISDCPKLENIIRLPACLRELKIRECGLLGEGIERKDPHIWPSISHIPYIKVDGKQIRNDSTS